jgi:hypothetical protein
MSRDKLISSDHSICVKCTDIMVSKDLTEKGVEKIFKKLRFHYHDSNKCGDCGDTNISTTDTDYIELWINDKHIIKHLKK